MRLQKILLQALVVSSQMSALPLAADVQFDRKRNFESPLRHSGGGRNPD